MTSWSDHEGPRLESGDCERCHGSGIDPSGYGKGAYGGDDCRRCSGTGTKEGGPL